MFGELLSDSGFIISEMVAKLSLVIIATKKSELVQNKIEKVLTKQQINVEAFSVLL